MTNAGLDPHRCQLTFTKYYRQFMTRLLKIRILFDWAAGANEPTPPHPTMTVRSALTQLLLDSFQSFRDSHCKSVILANRQTDDRLRRKKPAPRSIPAPTSIPPSLCCGVTSHGRQMWTNFGDSNSVSILSLLFR